MKSANISSPLLRSSKSKTQQKMVYKLSKPIFMKFRPQLVQQNTSEPGLLSKIISMSKLFSSPNAKTESKTQDESSSSKKIQNKPLRYLFKIEYDNYLIGNQYQLDSIVVNTLDEDVQTDLLWSFRLATQIEKVLVHDKKRNVILITNGQLRIYQFQGRKSKVVPFLVATFPIKDKVELIQFAEQSSVACITQNRVSIYTLDGVKSKQKVGCEYKKEEDLQIFQITQAIDNIFNIYFIRDCQKTQESDQDKTLFFELWCMGVQFKQKCIIQQKKMIYTIQKKYKQYLKIFAISKDCYIMNLGKLLYLFKKNYYIDKIVINMQSDYSYLQLFNQKTIGLVCQTQIDFYQLVTDLISNPPKISVKSFDSIRREDFDHKFMYLDGMKFEQHKYIFFFQIPNANYNGQINYQFYLTQKWNFEQKINSILPAIASFAGKLQQEKIKKGLLDGIDICWDVLNKMGLSRRDAYLRIWRQSKKQSVQQFNLLLDTHDYKTIRQEIQLKLKKKSMLLIEVLKIELGCLNMIQENIFNTKFTPDQFKNYLVSHYFMRKLESFKQIRIYQKESGKLRVTQNQQKQTKFFINIQEYTNAKQSDVKHQILELINGLCKYKKDNAREIRMLIRKFKFSLKMIYEQFLKEIIQIANRDILFLLQTIPQLLPYQYPVNQELDDPTLYKGVWGKFTDLQWQKSLFLDQVVTIHNRQKILQEMNSLWTKRNWLRYHDMVFKTKEQILKYHKQIQDGRLFYAVLSLIHQTQKDQDKINDITNYLQDTYIDFPSHLFSNVHLYQQLYLYFKANSKSSDTYSTFLMKDDQQIMKQIFDHEKAKKGSFLKEVKPIYERLKKSAKFNRALLKFFSSNLSEPSDIKYLLNRINNQKKQFHAQNEQMYEVLIKGMQIKLKLGSQRDIPIQEVLIYIENIPLKAENPVTKELQTLKKINEKGEKLKKTKLNMSVFEIIRMKQIVLYNVIGFQINQSGIRNDRDISKVVEKSEKILNEIKEVRQKIYGPYEDNVNLFVFIIKILQTVQMIPYVFDIIEKNKSHSIPFDNGQIQNAVLYLYKQTLINNPCYEQTSDYILQLITILPEDNHLRIFIRSQFQFASIINQNPLKFQYPICGQTGLLSILQLSAIIHTLDKSILPNLNIKRIVQLTKIIQQVTVGQVQIKQYQIYQTYCVALLRNGKLKEALNIIQTILEIVKDSEYLIIYPIVIFRSIFAQLIEENKNLMAQVIRILFDRPVELLYLYKTLLSNSFSNQDQRKLLIATIQKNSGEYLRFSPDNSLFKSEVSSFMKENPDRNDQFNLVFQHYYSQLLNHEQGFNKNPDVFLLYLLIIRNEKQALKYITFMRYQINMKMLRGFLSYLSQFDLFDSIKTLNYGKTAFKVLFNLQKNILSFQTLITEIFTSNNEEVNLQSLHNSKNCQILAISVDKFKAKIKIRQNLQAKAMKKILSKIQPESKISSNDEKYIKVIQILQTTQKQALLQYIYNDSDDYVSRVQKLSLKRVEKGSKKQFSVQKYLMWLFNRRNQLIQYYLLKFNEDQADEQLRIMQEKLKCSFTKTSNDGITNDNAGLLLKAFQMSLDNQQDQPQHTSPPSKSNFFSTFIPISNISVVQESQIRASDIFHTSPDSQILRLHGLTNLKDSLIKSLVINQDEAAYDYKLLLDLQSSGQLQKTLPSLFKDIYNESSITLQKSLHLIRQIYRKNSKLIFLNLQFIEIYMKIEQLLIKLNFSLQSRSLLEIQGLYIKQKDNSALFNFIKPSLFKQLNQNNFHTLSKIISVSFKKRQFEQDLNSQFLKNIITEYEQLDGNNQLDENLKIQKIKAFLLSMQTAHLKVQTPKTIMEMKNKIKKNKIVSLISETLRQKHDTKSADVFESKYMEILQ